MRSPVKSAPAERPLLKWNPYYAWFPTQAYYRDWNHTRWVWREWIEKMVTFSGCDPVYSYRIPEGWNDSYYWKGGDDTWEKRQR